MRCPFLKEVEVESCRSSAFRKAIVASPEGAGGERCTTAEHTACWAYREHPPEGDRGATCPYLERRLAQYCSASSPRKFIPYSESLLSRCGSSRYRYCHFFLMLTEAGEHANDPEVEGIRVPRELRYSSNHMWLAMGEDGLCHVGIDGFAARALGEVERITFVTEKGLQRPAAVLTVRGVDLSLVFPCPMAIQGTNAYLRGDPARLTASPYSFGWLFEGSLASEEVGEAPLLSGPEAVRWIEDEVDRASRFAHAETGASAPGQSSDGGVFAQDLSAHLGRDSLLRLFHDFFSPLASWTASDEYSRTSVFHNRPDSDAGSGVDRVSTRALPRSQSTASVQPQTPHRR